MTEKKDFLENAYFCTLKTLFVSAYKVYKP